MPIRPDPDDHLNINTIRQLLQVQAKSPNFLNKMKDGYFNSWQAHKIELKTSLESKKVKETLDLLHRIKGHAAMLGFKKIALQLQSAENELSINFDLNRGYLLLDDISDTTELTRLALDAFLNESTHSV